MISKEKLIETLDSSRGEVRSFVADLSDEQRLAKGAPNHWSAKDTVAHLTEWIARRARDLELAAQNPDAQHAALADDDNLDETNAEIFAQYQNLSWEEVLAQMEGAYEKMIAFAQAASLAELDDTRRIPWRAERPFWRILVGNAVEHSILHLCYYHVENGDFAEAARLQETSVTRLLELDDSPVWRGPQVYNLACIQSLSGQKEKALANLAEALQLAPDLIEWSKQDPDLVGLHDHPAYQALYAS